MWRPCVSLLACLVVALALPAPAAAQVRRCVDAQGNSVFTDRSCASVDASPREAPPPPGGAYAGGFGRRGCARTPTQLLDGVRGALEARDVNRLANFYHWPGTGSGAARSLMDTLEAVVARPLVAVSLLRPAAFPEWGDPDGSYFSGERGLDAPALTTPAGTPPAATDAPLAQADEPAPTALRVEQMAAAGDISTRQTTFTLRQHAACWWIQL